MNFLAPNACGRVDRRQLLTKTGMGLTGLVLNSMFQHAAIASDPKPWAPPVIKTLPSAMMVPLANQRAWSILSVRVIDR